MLRLLSKIEKYIHFSKKSNHLQVIPQQSTKKTQQIEVINIREKPVDVFYGTKRALAVAPVITFLI